MKLSSFTKLTQTVYKSVEVCDNIEQEDNFQEFIKLFVQLLLGNTDKINDSRYLKNITFRLKNSMNDIVTTEPRCTEQSLSVPVYILV